MTKTAEFDDKTNELYELFEVSETDEPVVLTNISLGEPSGRQVYYLKLDLKRSEENIS